MNEKMTNAMGKKEKGRKGLGRPGVLVGGIGCEARGGAVGGVKVIKIGLIRKVKFEPTFERSERVSKYISVGRELQR